MVASVTVRAPVLADKKAALLAPAKPYAFKGKGAVLRSTALQGVASLAYAEGKSRADIIAQARIVLGKSPTPADIAALSLEYIVGRVAQKLGNPQRTIAEQLTFARQLVTQYAAPVKDGVKAKPIRKHQLGRRTPEQHKAVRAAEGAWYLVNAELGFGTSQTQTDKNKRQAAMKGETSRGKTSLVTPTHADLAKGSAAPAKTAAEACVTVMQLAASLLAYSNKNAAHLPTAYGQSIIRFHGAIAELEKARAGA